MGNCSITKPTQTLNKHGQLFITKIHNGIDEKPIKYDATKGDLYINLFCEEEEVFAGDWINPPDEAEEINATEILRIANEYTDKQIAKILNGNV